MDYIIILFTALGLAMTAFAFALNCAMQRPSPKIGQFFTLTLWFTVFQTVMFVLGGIIGFSLLKFMSISGIWASISILIIFGFKKIAETITKKDDTRCFDFRETKTLALVSLANSFDAFIVGLSLAFIKLDLWGLALSVGIAIFVLTLFGAILGKKLQLPKNIKWLELVGGVALIIVAIKIKINQFAYV